jgi:hypothetical protein
MYTDYLKLINYTDTVYMYASLQRTESNALVNTVVNASPQVYRKPVRLLKSAYCCQVEPV